MRPVGSCLVVVSLMLGSAAHARAQAAPPPTTSPPRLTAGVELGVDRSWPLPADSTPTTGGMDMHVAGLLGFVVSGLETQVAVGLRARHVGFQVFARDLEFVTTGVRVRVPVRHLEPTPRAVFALVGLDVEHRLDGPNPDDKGRAGEADRAAFRRVSGLILVGAGVKFERFTLEGRAGWTPGQLSRVRFDLPRFRVFSLGVALTANLGRW